MNLDDPIAEITKAVRLHRQLAEQSKAGLQAALPVLSETLSHQSGQSAKVAAILQSTWNSELWDNLVCLHSQVAQAIQAVQTVISIIVGQMGEINRHPNQDILRLLDHKVWPELPGS